jgi:hypothetical protein
MASTPAMIDAPGGTGGMSALIGAFDWASHPFGPMEKWPEHMRFAVSLTEHTAIPATLFWGPEFRLIYNDAFALGPAARHPAPLGIKGQELFSDIWATLGANIERVFQSGEGHVSLQQMLPTIRDGIEEEVCWT